MINQCLENKTTDQITFVEQEEIKLQAAEINNCCRIVQFDE